MLSFSVTVCLRGRLPVSRHTFIVPVINTPKLQLFTCACFKRSTLCCWSFQHRLFVSLVMPSAPCGGSKCFLHEEDSRVMYLWIFTDFTQHSCSPSWQRLSIVPPWWTRTFTAEDFQSLYHTNRFLRADFTSELKEKNRLCSHNFSTFLTYTNTLGTWEPLVIHGFPPGVCGGFATLWHTLMDIRGEGVFSEKASVHSQRLSRSTPLKSLANVPKDYSHRKVDVFSTIRYSGKTFLPGDSVFRTEQHQNSNVKWPCFGNDMQVMKHCRSSRKGMKTLSGDLFCLYSSRSVVWLLSDKSTSWLRHIFTLKLCCACCLANMDVWCLKAPLRFKGE